MPRNLTPADASIKAVRDGDARKRLTDGDGLYLLLFVKGGAHGWRLDYSFQGQRKTLSLGTYPSRTLMRISAIVDAWNRLIVDGETASPERRWGSAQALGWTVA